MTEARAIRLTPDELGGPLSTWGPNISWWKLSMGTPLLQPSIRGELHANTSSGLLFRIPQFEIVA
jgi:hypothetical protein